MVNGFLLLLLTWSKVGATFADRFETRVHVQSSGRFAGREFLHRLFVPRDSTRKRAALIVWLHGLGGAGDNNFSQLRDMEGPLFVSSSMGEPSCYVLAVQCPREQPLWTDDPTRSADDMIDVLKDIVDSTLARHPIDEDRVLLVGLCSGGSATWVAMARYPHVFAAVAPLNSSVELSESAFSKAVPIWAFQSAHDPTVATSDVRGLVGGLRRKGWDATLTEIDSASHDCWTPAFKYHGLLVWLLRQRRGSTPCVWNSQEYCERKAKIRNWLNSWTWPWAALQAGYTVFLAGAVIAIARAARRSSTYRSLRGG